MFATDRTTWPIESADCWPMSPPQREQHLRRLQGNAGGHVHQGIGHFGGAVVGRREFAGDQLAQFLPIERSDRDVVLGDRQVARHHRDEEHWRAIEEQRHPIDGHPVVVVDLVDDDEHRARRRQHPECFDQCTLDVRRRRRCRVPDPESPGGGRHDCGERRISYQVPQLGVRETRGVPVER